MLPCVKEEIILYLCHLRYRNSSRSSPGGGSPQALNLVHSGFWPHHLKYVLNSGMDTEYSEADVAMQLVGAITAMTASEDDQLLLGLPTEELLWKATLNTGT